MNSSWEKSVIIFYDEIQVPDLNEHATNKFKFLLCAKHYIETTDTLVIKI